MQKNILVYTLEKGGYGAPSVYSFNDEIKVNIFENLKIDFKALDLL